MPDSENSVPEPRFRYALPLLVFWGLTPAIAMALAGLCMKMHVTENVSGLLMLGGFFGGPVVLAIWSFWIVRRMTVGQGAKVALAVSMTLGACVVNFFIALGACAAIDPPMNFH